MCYFRHIRLLDDQQETSESQMNCSVMMSPELSDEQRNKLSELLRKFSGLFTKTDKSTAAKTNVKHRIFTGDHAPINQRAYRVSPTERRIIHEEVQKMLDEGIVQPSESPWSSPVVLIVRVHYFVRGGFVGYRSRASSKHLSSSSGRVARFLGGGQTGVALDRKLHVWASNLQRNRHQMLLLFSRRDVTALALSYGTFPLRKV
ncbi:retrovirus-related Pol polyprotein from transposon 297 [Trichonephila clavipes]|nr:retrovirus-related Pol polyprotein from transposon 297 [Trichonephila clavipes]